MLWMFCYAQLRTRAKRNGCEAGRVGEDTGLIVWVFKYCLGLGFNGFIVYKCKNCEKFIKTFALCIIYREGMWAVLKYGEFPPYGNPTPSRVIKLIGPDKELFLLGRRSENQGMGIGAFFLLQAGSRESKKSDIW